MNDESWDGYQEYTVAQLIEALQQRPPEEVISVEVRDERGEVVMDELVQLRIGNDHDMDYSGVYRWTNIVVRREPSNYPPEATG